MEATKKKMPTKSKPAKMVKDEKQPAKCRAIAIRSLKPCSAANTVKRPVDSQSGLNMFERHNLSPTHTHTVNSVDSSTGNRFWSTIFACAAQLNETYVKQCVPVITRTDNKIWFT